MFGGAPHNLFRVYSPRIHSFVDTMGTSYAAPYALRVAAGIDAITTNLEAPQDILPGVGGIILQVRAEQADEARRLIEEYRSEGEQSADEAEASSETTEEPSA